MSIKPVVFGLAGTSLSDQERSFFTQTNPVGFILFARNCQTASQIINLVNELKTCTSGHPLILIDQEGGRVARLRPPEFPGFPKAGHFAEQAANYGIKTAEQAVYDNARHMATLLTSLGINVNCAPVADILFPETHAIIGDRSFGNNVEQVARLAKQMALGLQDGGVMPIIKHIPGHGRATVDSHDLLPVVSTPLAELQQTDFDVFRQLNFLPMAMTAHVVYSAIDEHLPATLSPKVINFIREQIGFNGVIITDALEMEALSGTLAHRAQQSIAAGCDLLLHCNGLLDQMQAIADVTPNINQRVQDLLNNIQPHGIAITPSHKDLG